LDSFRQHSLQQTIISNETIGNVGDIVMSTNTDEASNAADVKLPNVPYSFVSDTDSREYMLDTGANRFIVNNPRFLSNFVAISGSVKGIGGVPTSILGQGKLTLKLESDDGKHDTITIADAVYVPTSPFNIISPQMLVELMRTEGYYLDYFKHNDKEYLLQYTPKGGRQSDRRTLTVRTDH
jgi:hypothetical protein